MEPTGTHSPFASTAAPPATGVPTTPDEVAEEPATESLRSEAPADEASTEARLERPLPKPAAVTLTISEAARACDVNRRTIRHHRQAGDFPGAFKDQDGLWRIPVEDLEWVGFQVDLGRVSEEPWAAGKMDLLRTEVAVLRERLRAAELIAAEREKRIDDLRLILRLLPSASLPASFLPGSAGVSAGRDAGPALTAGRGSPAATHAESGVGESDPVLWLPDAPEARAVPVGSRPRTGEADRGSIWTPGGAPTSKEDEGAPSPASAPRPLGSSSKVPRRLRWLPWRRSGR